MTDDKAQAYIAYLQNKIDRHNRRSDDILMYQDYDVWQPAPDDTPTMENVRAMLTEMSEPLDLPIPAATEPPDDIMQHTHYQAIINDDYPRWSQREIGRFLKWEDARSATFKELDRLYQGMWEINFEHKETTSQYVPTEEHWENSGFCMALINRCLNETDQLEHDIDYLSKELAAKQQRLEKAGIETSNLKSVTWICKYGLIHDIDNRLIIDEVPFDIQVELLKLGTAPYRITITTIKE